ncbi:hypothetical protein CALCODRAFT_490155 [Calocera cornea HHB12733]|uniref:O-fucosyltransferase family protein n=1 Tax=Calocera cornea HHB12733 TaxID=1353952 RepID=A0A165JW32_9BASI|nr:hypothetical protein CALCODRAFT_490155 [Calocera cornea HHB12733]
MKRQHLPRPSLTLERGLTLLSHLRPPSRGPASASSHSSSCPPSPNAKATAFPTGTGTGSSMSGIFPTAAQFSTFENTMTQRDRTQSHHASPGRSRSSTPRPSFSPTWSPSLSSLATWHPSQRTPLLPLRSPPGAPGVRRWTGRRWSKFRWAATSALALLGMLLVWICFPSPLTHPLFTPLALLPALSLPLSKHPAPDFPAPPWPPTPLPPPTEKYLTYLPHSGLHNQLIELQNALLLAALLGRTLLVPEVRVGRAAAWRASGVLRGVLGCGLDLEGDGETAQARECEQEGDYAYVPMTSLFSLPPHSAVRTLPLPSPLPLAHHLSTLNITPLSTFHLPDTHPYQHKFFELSTLARPMGRYSTRVNLDDLARETRHHRLLSLGSLFGTSRIKLASRPAKALRRTIKAATTFSHPAVLRSAKRVIRKLGGRDAYVAAHVRLGDGEFEKEGEGRVREVWWALVRSLGLPEELAGEVERWAHSIPGRNATLAELGPPPLEPPEDRQVLKSPHPPLKPFRTPPPRPALACAGPLHTRPELQALNTPLFLATPSPSSPLLAPLLRTFPCSFSLSHPALHTLVQPVRQLTTEDGRTAGTWLQGAVDALVASEGRWVKGTRGSTFSGWVGDVGWRIARGWDVVDRG